MKKTVTYIAAQIAVIGAGLLAAAPTLAQTAPPIQVPEPSTLGLLATGVAAYFILRRRK